MRNKLTLLLLVLAVTAVAGCATVRGTILGRITSYNVCYTKLLRSRSLTESRELSEGRLKPSSSATSSRSIGNVVPAIV